MISEQNVDRFIFDLPKLLFEILIPLFIAIVKVVSASMLKANLNMEQNNVAPFNVKFVFVNKFCIPLFH